MNPSKEEQKHLRKTLAGCRACQKFKKIENKENGWNAWITCSKWGEQRLKTCRTCTKNKANPIGKKERNRTRIARKEPINY